MDSGYDLSSYPRATHQTFQPDAYSTVGALLNESSGDTAATFVSGAGLAAETLEEVFERALSDEEMRFARAHYTPVDEDDFSELVETLSEDDRLTGARYSWLETFLERPLGEVVTPYWAQAKGQLTLEAAQAQAAARLATARRAHQEALGARALARLERAGIRTEAHYDMTTRQHIEALMHQLEALGAEGPELHAFVVTQLSGRLSNKLTFILKERYPELQN